MREGRLRQFIVAGPMLLAMTGLMVGSGLHKRLSDDEPYNLRYGCSFVTEGPDATPLGQRMPVLALNALACLPSGCALAAVNATEWSRLAVRWPTMVFALLLGLVVFCWARELYGPPGGLLALALCCFNPNFVAHGKQVTTDVPASFFAVASVYALWRLFQRPRLSRLLLCAALTAGALASKLTNLLLPVFFALASAVEFLRARGRGGEGALLRPSKAQAWALAFVAGVLLFLNAAYLFQGTLRPARDWAWRSRLLAPLANSALPLPLPSGFALGLDHSLRIQEGSTGGLRGMNYALGRLDWGRIPYAFPLMLLLKTPLAFFPLLAMAAAARPPQDRRGEEALYLWGPFLGFFVFYTLFVVPQLGIRYLLPAIAFLTVYAGRAAGGPSSRQRRLLVGGLVAWYVGSSLSYHPHYMSYFNELIGPRVNAYRFLADSNLDWEDRTYFLEEFRRQHPEISFTLEPEAPQSGYIVVRANQLLGILGDPERYRWLRKRFRPLRHVAYSYLLFFVPPRSHEGVPEPVGPRGGSPPATR